MSLPRTGCRARAHAQGPVRPPSRAFGRRAAHVGIAAISSFADVGDTTTLASPEIVVDILHMVRGEKLARGNAPRELAPEEEAQIKAFGQAE